MTQPVKKVDPSIFTPFARRLAHRCIPYLPRRVTPNQITIFGFIVFLLADLAFVLARFSRLWFLVIVVGLLVHWLTDDLDGEYARARNMTSERGFFLDILLDAVGGTAMAAGIACSGYVHPALMIIYLVMYLLGVVLSILVIVVRQEFYISKVGPSELYAVAIILVTLTFIWPGPVVSIAGYGLSWFDLVLLVTIPIGLVEWLALAIRTYRRLEPPR